MKTVYFVALLTIALSQSVFRLGGGNSCCDQSVVTVNGNARVTGVPDIAAVTIRISETAKTTREASAAVNTKVQAVLRILNANLIQTRDIKTTQLNISPVYDYNNGTQTLRGQEASQTITAKVRNLAKDGTNLGRLVDQLAGIDNINLSGISFDIENKKPLSSKARDQAFEDAKAKAQQYADLSGLRLGSVQSITDSSTRDFTPYPMYASAGRVQIAQGAAEIPVGEL